MKYTLACFAASRYWKDRAELEKVFSEVSQHLPVPDEGMHLIVDGAGIDLLAGDGEKTLVILPMSGAVQADILRAAKGFGATVLYAAYVSGNAAKHSTDLMMAHNAAPTLMDCWSVLRKTHGRPLLALNSTQLLKEIRLLEAYQALQGRTILLIGETEPWVISVSRDYAVYERLNIHIKQVSQKEVEDLYALTSNKEAAALYDRYAGGAESIAEPTEKDVRNAARMATALLKMMQEYRADALAIACFNLLSLGTTSCLGVSFINTYTDKVAACEGDLDSALTMLMLRRLAKTSLWMANPALHPDGLVNFSHCTAPLSAGGATSCPYVLRSHHESGIGASLEVDLPKNAELTACRVSAMWGTFTAHKAVSLPGKKEQGCRTQLYVRFNNVDEYLATALGCHQIFCFEDVRDDFARLAQWMGLKPESGKETC